LDNHVYVPHDVQLIPLKIRYHNNN
jgi:hypothetical protein